MAETERETAKLAPEARRAFIAVEQRADPFAVLPSKAKRKLAAVIESQHRRHLRRYEVGA